jgi:hypothetical protein
MKQCRQTTRDRELNMSKLYGVVLDYPLQSPVRATNDPLNMESIDRMSSE